MRHLFSKQTQSKPTSKTSSEVYDVVVIGAGAAGVGIGVALKDAGLKNFLIVDRNTVGASFAAWPDETRFITPSFSTNSVGMLDLNSVAVGISPAYSLEVEHPTGREYAAHLIGVAALFHLPIRAKTNVLRVSKPDDEFRIDTQEQTLRAKHVVWAAGEFQYPRLKGLNGGEFCQHTATVASYKKLEGDDFIVIGGYESGVDAAYHLACAGKRVRLFDSACPWQTQTSDPSAALSTYSLQRMREQAFEDQVTLYPHTKIFSVTRDDDLYQVETEEGDRFQSPVPPLFAGGFDGSHKLTKDLFEQREDGFPPSESKR